METTVFEEKQKKKNLKKKKRRHRDRHTGRIPCDDREIGMIQLEVEECKVSIAIIRSQKRQDRILPCLRGCVALLTVQCLASKTGSEYISVVLSHSV